MQWEAIKSNYSSYVFDCDGVILDSNNIKSDSFLLSVDDYDDDFAQKFLSYHKANGGITRQVKFEYFCREILQLTDWHHTYEGLLSRYSEIVKEGLKKARFIPGVLEILQALSDNGKSIFVVTGGSELETKEAFHERGIDHYFSAILGNPISKRDNMYTLARAGNFKNKSFYFGDSRLDFELASAFNLDFLCIYGVSEWSDIPEGLTKAKNFLSIVE